MKKENLSESILINIKEGIEDKNYAEWKKVCEEFCKRIKAELLFVNSDNFGYEDKDGNLIHMYADELAEYLKSIGEDLKEAYVEKKDNVDIEELAKEIMSTIELYDENKMNAGSDIFAGTEDAYAEEVFEQNLYDNLLYSGLFHIESLQQEIENPTEDGSKLESLYNGIIQIVEYGDAFKGKTENLVNYLNSVLKESIKGAVDKKEHDLNESIKEFEHVNDVWNYLEDSKSEEDLKERISEIDHDKFGSIYYDLHKDGKGATVIIDYQSDNEDYYEKVDIYFDNLNEGVETKAGNKEAVDEHKYTLSNCIEQIKAIDDPKGFYDKVREIVGYNDEEWNNYYGWEDHEIKRLQREADARYEELKGTLEESENTSLRKLKESYQVSGKAYVTLWDGDTGTIEMKPYTIEEITPEAICQGANDAEFGVKEITGIEALVDGEAYEFFDEEFKKYSKGKEKKGIQIPPSNLGDIKDIECYCLYTSRENYPVIKVNDKYLITRAGTNDFSGQWRLEGFLPFRMYSYRNLIKPDVALGIKDWLLKNGNSKYKVVDYDHGSTRIWSGSPRYLLTGFMQADKDFFKRLIGGKDSVIIEGKEYKLNDNLEEAVKPNQSYIDFLKKNLGDTYQEEETDNYLIIRGKRDDKPIAALWYGRAQRPQIYSSFRSEEDREKYIQNFLNNKASDEEAKAKRKEERKLTRDHDIKVGDIFYTSWGYDQTNIDFYEVVNVRGSRIDLKEIGHRYLERGDGGYPDLIEPVPGSYINDNIITVSARVDGTVTSISSFEYPSRWDGKPKYQTNPYSGH